MRELRERATTERERGTTTARGRYADTQTEREPREEREIRLQDNLDQFAGDPAFRPLTDAEITAVEAALDPEIEGDAEFEAEKLVEAEFFGE